MEEMRRKMLVSVRRVSGLSAISAAVKLLSHYRPQLSEWVAGRTGGQCQLRVVTVTGKLFGKSASIIQHASRQNGR